MKTIAAAAVLCVAAAGVALSDDSLAEAARRERERRAASAKARAYTEADLQAGRPAGRTSPAPSQPSPSPAPSPEASAPDAEQRAALERSWRERFAEARRKLWEADSRAYETVIEPVYVGGETRGVWVPMQVRRKIETEELRQAKKALADLEEELRVAGLPPGWGRE
jgi:hypothetical protein